MTIRISRRVVVSAAPFVFARTTIAAAATYRPDASVLPMLGGIADAIDRATPIGGSFVHQPRFLPLPTGQDGKRALRHWTARWNSTLMGGRATAIIRIGSRKLGPVVN